jgi:uncharacterized metal-binding protein
VASGVVHAKVATMVWIVCLSGAVYAVLYWQTQVAIGLALGGLGGLLITPDIDHFKRTHEEYRIYWHLGPLAGKLWQAYWSPYSIFIPHRHWLSHFPVVGTALRILYLGIPLWIAVYVLDVSIPDWRQAYVSAFVAWAVQDFFHWVFDGFGLKD